MSSESENDEQITCRLQLQVAHPLHNNHTLAFIDSLDTLQRHFMMSFQEFTNPSITRILFRSTGFFNCDGCDISSSGSSYHCLECQFSLESECAKLSVITVADHPHPLLLLKRKTEHRNLICCDCEEEIVVPSFSRCVECDVFMHVQCALPIVIVIKNHHHPIVLSSPIFFDGDDDLEPCCCSVCGGQRDPFSWVYFCGVCRFIAHVGCVIYDYELPGVAETQHSIANQLSTLELDETKTNEAPDQVEEELNQEFKIKPGITLNQILDSFTESEAAEYEAIGTTMAGDIGNDDDSETDHETKYLNHFSYLEKPLYDLLEKLDFEEDSDSEDSPFQGLDMDSPTLVVDQYLIVQTMADTFSRVLNKHGDIIGTSNLSIKVKIMVCNLFCKVVDEMSEMEIGNVTAKVLVTWMFGIRTIQLTGFEVQFAFDHWKKLAFAFFGLQGKSMADNLLDEMDREMEELNVKLQNLRGKREQLLNLMEDCIEQGMVMEGKNAANGLI